MNRISALARLVALGVKPEAIRVDIFLVGSRHHGEALKGACLELSQRASSRGAADCCAP